MLEKKYSINIIITLLLMTGNIILSLKLESISFFFFHLILSISLFFLCKDRRILSVLLFNVTVLTSIFFYFYWEGWGSNYFQGLKSDDYNYEMVWGKDFYQISGLNYLEIHEIPSIGILHNSPGYVYVIALLRYFGDLFDGFHTLLPRIFNGFILIILSNLLAKTLIRLNLSESIAQKCMATFVFFPVILFNSVHTFRDTIIAFLIFTGFYILQFKKNKKRYYFLLIASIITLSQLRFFAAILVLALTPIFFISEKNLRKYFLIVGVIFGVGFITYISYDNSLLATIERYDVMNTERTGGIGEKIFSLPKSIGWISRISFLVMTPVPKLTSFYQFFISISAYIQVLLFPVLLLALKDKKVNLKIKIFFLAFFFSIAMTTVTFRHVMMFFPFAFLLVFIKTEELGNPFRKNIYWNHLIGTLGFISLGLIIALIF